MTLRQLLRTIQTTLFDSRPTLIVNSFFNNSQLKPRIQMLINPKTNRRDLWRYTLMMPLLAVLVGLTAAREPLTEMIPASQSGPIITISGRVIDTKGKPLVGTAIMDGHQLTKTDSRGYYKIVNVVVPANVMFSHVGFEPVLRSVNRAGTVNMRLRRTREELPTMGATANFKAVGVKRTSSAPADPVSTEKGDERFTIVERKPEFPTGIPGLMYYVAHNLRYPAEARKAKIQGKVLVKFVVTATGTVNDVRAIKGIGFGCNEEAVRVVSRMPKWTPARQYGKPVSVEYVLPIQFALEKQEDKRTGQLDRRPTISTENVNPGWGPTNLVGGRYATDTVPVNKLDAGPPRYRLRTNFMRNGEKVRFFMDGKRVEWESPPLFVIDGVMSAKSDGLGSINPDQILSIGVLKDESAIAIYGEKGMNGVVMITTKPKKP